MIIIIIVLDEEEMEDDYTPLIYPEAGIILLDNYSAGAAVAVRLVRLWPINAILCTKRGLTIV